MGTRHLIMVVKDNKTVVAQYAQWDGYPDGQGVNVLAFARNLKDDTNAQQFNDALDKCFFVTDEVGDEMWAERAKNETAFPQITRDASTDIFDLILGNTDDTYPLIDSEDFAQDSLFCEWAYVLDMDTRTLEAYTGFNHLPVPETNRFQLKADIKTIGSDSYHPVLLNAKFIFDDLPTDEQFIEKLDPPEDEEVVELDNE